MTPGSVCTPGRLTDFASRATLGGMTTTRPGPARASRPTLARPTRAASALSRRAFLRRAGALGATGAAGGWALALAACGRSAPKPKPPRAVDVGTAEAFALLQRVAPADALADTAALIERGLSHDELRAALVAAWAEVDGDVHGGLALHGLIAVERELGPRQRLLALFRAVDHQVAHRAAWKPMPPRKPVPKALLGLGADALTDRLRAAFDALEADDVRLSARALHQRWGQEAVSAPLFAMAARDDGFGGHSAHLVVAGLDLLRTVRWHAADAVLDQLCTRLQPPGSWQAPPSRAARSAFLRHRAAATQHGERWQRGVRQMTASRALRQAARTRRGDALEAQVTAALERGVHPDALWDGLSLAAADMTLVDPSPSGPGVHGLLLVSALRQAARRSPTPQARATALLGAAWRLPSHRPAPGATPLPTSATASEFNRLTLSPARKRRADAIRAAAAGGGARALAVRDGMRDLAIRKATPDPHQLEVPVAATRLAAVAAPAFQADILAAVATCGPDPTGPDWARLDEARKHIAALRRG